MKVFYSQCKFAVKKKKKGVMYGAAVLLWNRWDKVQMGVYCGIRGKFVYSDSIIFDRHSGDGGHEHERGEIGS